MCSVSRKLATSQSCEMESAGSEEGASQACVSLLESTNCTIESYLAASQDTQGRSIDQQMFDDIKHWSQDAGPPGCGMQLARVTKFFGVRLTLVYRRTMPRNGNIAAMRALTVPLVCLRVALPTAARYDIDGLILDVRGWECSAEVGTDLQIGLTFV